MVQVEKHLMIYWYKTSNCSLYTCTHTYVHTESHMNQTVLVSCNHSYLFDKKTNISILSGFMVALNGDTIFPAVLNSLSDGEIVAHIHKYFCAIFPTTVYCKLFEVEKFHGWTRYIKFAGKFSRFAVHPGQNVLTYVHNFINRTHLLNSE